MRFLVRSGEPDLGSLAGESWPFFGCFLGARMPELGFGSSLMMFYQLEYLGAIFGFPELGLDFMVKSWLFGLSGAFLLDSSILQGPLI